MTPTAMVVEDEAVLREDLVERLRRLWPQLVLTNVAGDGLEAMRFLEEEAPDVIFLDIRMPGVSGLEVAKSLRGRSHVVFITAYDAHAVEARRPLDRLVVELLHVAAPAHRDEHLEQRLRARGDVVHGLELPADVDARQAVRHEPEFEHLGPGEVLEELLDRFHARARTLPLGQRTTPPREPRHF